jgi:hypothetical protein
MSKNLIQCANMLMKQFTIEKKMIRLRAYTPVSDILNE